MQLWCGSNLGRLAFSLRRFVTFYAPLTDSLDFMGVDPVAFARGTVVARLGRDGLGHTVPMHVPKFDYVGEQPYGLYMDAAVDISWSPLNALHDANTVIWFEDAVPKSTPANANPVNSAGHWGGNRNIHLKHLTKFNLTLGGPDIVTVQQALADVATEIPLPEPPTPPTPVTGTPVYHVFTGRNGSNTVFTLPSTPNINSLLIFAHGVSCQRVASAPQAMEYTISGVTVTMGMAPSAAGAPFFAQYFQ